MPSLLSLVSCLLKEDLIKPSAFLRKQASRHPGFLHMIAVLNKTSCYPFSKSSILLVNQDWTEAGWWKTTLKSICSRGRVTLVTGELWTRTICKTFIDLLSTLGELTKLCVLGYLLTWIIFSSLMMTHISHVSLQLSFSLAPFFSTSPSCLSESLLWHRALNTL